MGVNIEIDIGQERRVSDKGIQVEAGSIQWELSDLWG